MEQNCREEYLPYQEKVLIELRDIEEKLSKLLTFMATDIIYSKLKTDDKFLLIQQSQAMKLYISILEHRVSKF